MHHRVMNLATNEAARTGLVQFVLASDEDRASRHLARRLRARHLTARRDLGLHAHGRGACLECSINRHRALCRLRLHRAQCQQILHLHRLGGITREREQETPCTF